MAASPAAAQALARLQSATGAQVVSQVSRETGVYSFVRATGAAVLSADDASATPEKRALAFLSTHGALFGMSEAERTRLSNAADDGASQGSEMRAVNVHTDSIGSTHVRLNQFYQGRAVFGAQLVVHMNERGITAVNGNFVPGINVKATPGISEAAAGQSALSALRKEMKDSSLKIVETGLSIYRTGLLEGYRGQSVLAYSVNVSDSLGRLEQVWVDAQTGAVLNRIPLRHEALNRRVYSPKYDSSNPDLFVVRKEEDLLPSPNPAIEGLFQFTGHAYNLFSSAFGRDSFDGNGSTMRTVYLVNSVCPNAYWDGQTTNYCPEIDADDVVAHEWTHGYTQFTHDLVYSFQSGALNESYSDIFGEMVDQLNGMDSPEGGIDNDHPTEYTFDEDAGQWTISGGGVRWRIGEDVSGLNQPAALGILRDMWSPTVWGDPDKVSSTAYHCGADDGGGVHTNSGVPNHAFALLVDGTSSLPGGTFNTVAVTGIGRTKALHIYFRAMSVYQTPTTNFAQHEQALRASCQDLIGQNLNGLSTSSAAGTSSGETITAANCQSVADAMAAVEMSKRPEQCHFGPLFNPNTPAACNGATNIFTEDWEDGNMDGWTKTSTGSFAGWPNHNWELDNTLPAGRTGTAAFANGGSGGICGDPNGDYSGQFTIDSPTITVPQGASDLKMSFDQFVASEFLVDGGNVKISKNGGAFTLVPQENYIFNGPPDQLRAAPPTDQNTNPKAGEFAWSGADPEVPAFGTTVIDLSTLVAPGDTFKIRFDFGKDGCGGNQGWYVDNIRVYDCPVLAAPVLAIGSGYENPDTDGSYQLTWTRPAGATGPDTLEQSTSSCGPLFADDAESEFAQWNLTTEGTGAFDWETSTAKPQHDSTAFWARAAEGATNASSILTSKNKITLPSGGTTALTFSDWNINESDDSVYVEVSEDGSNWSVVYTNSRSELAPTAGEFFGTEPLSARQVDLTTYKGKSIYLRFRFTAGADNKPGSTPFGWYVDNISVTNDNWSTLTSVNGTSYTVTVAQPGTFCYRVRTAFTFGSEVAQSPFSNSVKTVVERVAVPPPALTLVSMTLSSTSATAGCRAPTGNVTLSAPAPAGGTIVTLTSEDPSVASVPASIKVPAGAANKVFPITVKPVTSRRIILITATLGTSSVSRRLLVEPNVLQGMVLNPNPVRSGQYVSGVLTLKCPAPAGGINVALSSSVPSVANPTVSNITIAAGKANVAFKIRTARVSSVKNVVIKAAANGKTLAQTLRVNP
jgi:Zn-dependent metalloprotease